MRQELHRRSLAGQPATQIAKEMRLAERTVRRLLARLGPQPAGEAFLPSYARCGHQRACHSDLYKASVRLRLENPDWGAGRICVSLPQECPGQEAPAPRLVRRWLAQAGLAPKPAILRPPEDGRRAQEPHHVWQMDACEQIPLGDATRASWLRGFDECSGSVLWTDIFPPRALGQGRGRPDAGRDASGLLALGATGQVARR